MLDYHYGILLSMILSIMMIIGGIDGLLTIKHMIILIIIICSVVCVMMMIVIDAIP